MVASTQKQRLSQRVQKMNIILFEAIANHPHANGSQYYKATNVGRSICNGKLADQRSEKIRSIPKSNTVDNYINVTSHYIQVFAMAITTNEMCSSQVQFLQVNA